tara:strand:+ start:3166 stop:4371 length:1206 start_codon:yes stop_codon:yes gene_type:complete
MFILPTGDSLVDFIKDFTGSTNDTEIKQCIFMAEMSMRNIELPALRSDPYAVENIGIADQYGRIPIPGDMNKPILFFKQGSQVTTTATATGTSAQFTITLTSTPAQTISNNMLVSGTGIASGALISNISGVGGIGDTVTLNLANTGTVSGTLVFSTTGNASSQTGPWIVYDRIGDRDIITQGMIAQLYLQPVNVPAVIRGKFSEVYNKYQFLPYIAQGDLINMYYYKAWPLLFAPVTDEVISTTGSVNPISGSGPWLFGVSGMTTVGDLEVGDEIYATDGTGSFGGGTTVVTSIVNSTTITATTTGAPSPTGGTVTGITQTGLTVQNNAVLQTWPEGYVYSTLREYYIKRHNDTDAAVYQTKFQDAWNVVSDQNNLGKWSGGHTRLTSVWQPRQYRQYNIK